MIDLVTSDAYRAATPAALAEITNGCGPGAWKWNLLPKHLRAVMKPACDYHDWLYYLGGDAAAQKYADDMLLVNCTICALNHTDDPIEMRLLLLEAKGMHTAVRLGGHNHFGRAA